MGEKQLIKPEVIGDLMAYEKELRRIASSLQMRVERELGYVISDEDKEKLSEIVYLIERVGNDLYDLANELLDIKHHISDTSLQEGLREVGVKLKFLNAVVSKFANSMGSYLEKNYARNVSDVAYLFEDIFRLGKKAFESVGDMKIESNTFKDFLNDLLDKIEKLKNRLARKLGYV